MGFCFKKIRWIQFKKIVANIIKWSLYLNNYDKFVLLEFEASEVFTDYWLRTRACVERNMIREMYDIYGKKIIVM